VTELRISYDSTVGLEFFADGQKTEIPGRFRGWAVLYEGLGLRVAGERIALSKSRFLRELPSIVSLRDELGLETILNDAAAQLVQRFRDERTAFNLALHGESISPQSTETEILKTLRNAGFKRVDSLRDHQLRSITKLIGLRHGANFSVPGAGKTTVLLALHEIERSLRPNLQLLIIAPKNAMGAWDIEIGQCLALPPKIVRLSGGLDGVRTQLSRQPRAAIMTYEMLRTTFEAVISHLDSTDVHVVLDESHRAKAGYESMQGAAVLEIAPSAYRRDILSGTPMPQRISDICSQMSFVWPFETFCGRLIQEDVPDALSQANRTLSPMFTRTTKKELGLPPIERVSMAPLPMATHQERAYRMLRAEAGRRFRTSDLESTERIRALGKQVVTLLQLASNPSLAYKRLRDDPSAHDFPEFLETLRFASEEETPTKFRALDDIVETLMSNPMEKVVIWSSFVGTIKEIERRFAEYGALSIHGGIKTGSDQEIEFREARVKRFNEDPRYRVMVANPAAGGEGISLHHACHNAIYFDRNFNAAQYLQSIDRIHRLGLSDDILTRVYILESAASIDEVLSARLSDKVRAMEIVLDDFGIELLALDTDEVVEDNEAGLDFADERALMEHLLGG